MRVLLPVLLAAASLPFWEAKPRAEWTDEELLQMFTESPWVQKAVSGKTPTGILAYLATAQPMREAEAERARREPQEAQDTEYADFLRENEGKVIVLAVLIPNPKVLDDVTEVKLLEEHCVLRVGGKRYKTMGHFPPAEGDQWLRLVFPRAVTEGDKSFTFDLYVPSTGEPLRFVQFRTADLRYKGKLEL